MGEGRTSQIPWPSHALQTARRRRDSREVGFRAVLILSEEGDPDHGGIPPVPGDALWSYRPGRCLAHAPLRARRQRSLFRKIQAVNKIQARRKVLAHVLRQKVEAARKEGESVTLASPSKKGVELSGRNHERYMQTISKPGVTAECAR